MAERDVVRITFKEIQSIAGTSKEDYQEEETKTGDSNKRRKRTKRPEQAIYRPGQLRVGKKEKEISNNEERAGSIPPEEESWEAEIEASRVKDVYGTTDEEGSRGSKENSLDKEVGPGSGRDAPRFTPSPSAAPHRDKGEGGRRRSKRPDIQIYVPKGRLQEQDCLRGDEEDADVGQMSEHPNTNDEVRDWLQEQDRQTQRGNEEDAEMGRMIEPPSADYEVCSLPAARDFASPRKVDLSSHFGALQVTVGGNPSSPLSVDEDRLAGASADSAGHRHQQTPPSKQRGGTIRDEQCDKPKHSNREGGWEQKEHQYDRGDSHSSKKRDHEQQGGRWRERDNRGRGRHSESDRVEPPFREPRAGGRGRGSEERDFAAKEQRDYTFKEHKVGRGRGRNRQLQYNRSSSNESLTKSLDLGHRAQWPGERMTQHSGTFPRSKGAKNRNLAADSNDSKEDIEASQAQGSGKYAFSSMRPPRERSGSISSDTSGGSDLSWEDLEAEFEKEKPDWNTQVEQYLEEVARQVHDSTQRLTDSIDNSFDPHATPTSNCQQPRLNHNQPGLNRNLSASSDRIFTQEYRGRKKDRRRRGSRSKNSSRESSIHSNPRDDDLWPSEEKRPPRRRNRRRHSSAGPGNRVGTVEGQRAAESLRIMVGKNKEKRQVMVGSKGAEGGAKGADTGGAGGDVHRRQRQHSGADLPKRNAEHDRPQQQQQQRDRHGGRGGRAGSGSQGQGQGHGSEGKKQSGRLMQSTGDGEERLQGRGQHHDNKKSHPHSHPHSNQQHNSRSHGSSSNNNNDPYHQPGSYSRLAPSPAHAPDNASSPPISHAGGLIKLPSESPAERPHPAYQGHGQGRSQAHRPEWTPGQGQEWGQSYGQDRGQGYNQEQAEDRFRRNSTPGHSQGQGPAERRLYDPKNPSKPIMVPDSRPLKFHDPEEMHSPSPQESFTPPPLSHSPGPAGSAGVGPAFPPFFPPHPGYMYPPPHMRMPFPGFPHGPPPPPNHPMFYGFQPPRPGTDADDGYYNRELEQLVSGMSRPQCRMMAEQVLRDTAPLDCQLTNILSRGQLGEDAQRRVKQLRQELQRRYERILLLDMDVANQRSVEQQLWRSVYYNVIEGLRRQQAPDNSGGAAASKQALSEILDEGTAFYEGLLKKLQSTYNFNLDSLLEEGPTGTEGAGRGCDWRC